eukprot:gene11492-11635_t
MRLDLQSHPIDLAEVLTSSSRSARTLTHPSKLVKLQRRLRHLQQLLKVKLPQALAAKASALKQVKLLEAQLAAKDTELMALKRELVQVCGNSELLSSWLDSGNMQLKVCKGQLKKALHDLQKAEAASVKPQLAANNKVQARSHTIAKRRLCLTKPAWGSSSDSTSASHGNTTQGAFAMSSSTMTSSTGPYSTPGMTSPLNSDTAENVLDGASGAAAGADGAGKAAVPSTAAAALPPLTSTALVASAGWRKWQQPGLAVVFLTDGRCLVSEIGSSAQPGDALLSLQL